MKDVFGDFALINIVSINLNFIYVCEPVLVRTSVCVLNGLVTPECRTSDHLTEPNIAGNFLNYKQHGN